jgi:hypothetical protein
MKQRLIGYMLMFFMALLFKSVFGFGLYETAPGSIEAVAIANVESDFFRNFG